jgi:hypothetical protein
MQISTNTIGRKKHVLIKDKGMVWKAGFEPSTAQKQLK